MSTTDERMINTDSYVTLISAGFAMVDGTAAECEAWRKWIRGAARKDRVKIQTGRCTYLTREGRHRVWAHTPERPHGSATEAELEARRQATTERLNRLFSGPGDARAAEVTKPFPWVEADWT